MRARLVKRGLIEHLGYVCLAAVIGLLFPCLASAQSNDQSVATPSVTRSAAADLGKQSDSTDNVDSGVMFPHFESDRVWLSGQANLISQWHPTFHSLYQGPNSLSPEAQDATSGVLTLFTGVRLGKWSEVLLDVQQTGGNGIG